MAYSALDRESIKHAGIPMQVTSYVNKHGDGVNDLHQT